MPNGTEDIGEGIVEGAAEAYSEAGALASGILSWLTLGLTLVLLIVSLIALIKLRHTMYVFFSIAGLAGFADNLLVFFNIQGDVLFTVMEWLIYVPLIIGLLLAMRDKMLREFLRNR
jgi:hypothetical protein